MKENGAKFWNWLRAEKRWIWCEYAALALIILLPLLLPGYILTLDLVFTPTFAWPQELTNAFPLQALLWILHFVLPGDVIEKIILFLILLLSGVGMHTLLRQVSSKERDDSWRMAAYFAGIFYMINPFTYSRFMAGQWMVLLGYALLPFFFSALLRLIAIPSLRSMTKVIVWAFTIISISLHHVGILFLLGMLTVIVGLVKYRHRALHVRRLLLYSVGSALGVLLLSSFWVIPALLGQGSINAAIESFDQTDYAAFATNGHGALGAVGEVVRLQGFWAEDQLLYALPQSLIPLWGVIFLLLWVIIVIGAIKAWHRHRTLVILALGSIILGILIAVTPIVSWVSHIIPFASGYREPHKFVNLVVLGYAILGALGVVHIARWAAEKFDEIGYQLAVIVCLLLPLAVTPTMLWGFAGQLSPRSYPSEWYQMNETLKVTAKGERVLFLPWHQYMQYDFSNRIIANPAGKFFETEVITSDEPEFHQVTPTVPDKEKEEISVALKHPKNIVDVLTDHTIHYILLAKEKDDADYSYLDKLDGVHLVEENAKLKLYRVEGR